MVAGRTGGEGAPSVPAAIIPGAPARGEYEYPRGV
jgi:hypothetical protein